MSEIQQMPLSSVKPQPVHPATLLRIFVGTSARYKSKPLYESIVMKAREMHLAGATVLRGSLGYGHSTRLHAQKILQLSADLPIVIEIIDSPDKIDTFLPTLDGMMTSGLVTIEQIDVIDDRTLKNDQHSSIT